MPTSSKTKKRISITIVPFIDSMLETVSKQSGVSKSSLVEKALNEYLKDRLDKDSKALANLDLEDLPSEDEWTQIQSNLE